MSEYDYLIKREIPAWLALRDWPNESPTPDVPFEDIQNFYSKKVEFFSNKVETLTRLHLEKLLRELEDEGSVELTLNLDNTVKTVRGLKPKRAIWIDIPPSNS